MNQDPLFPEHGLLMANISPTGWYVYTGMPTSYADMNLTIAGSPAVAPWPEELVTQGFGDRGRPGMLGSDVLNNYDIYFALNTRLPHEGWIQISSEPMNLPDYHLRGRDSGRITLEFLRKINLPVVTLCIKGRGQCRMLFDTGTQHAYLTSLSGLSTTPIGSGSERHPIYGEYQVDLHGIEATLGNTNFNAVFATLNGKLTCPPGVRDALRKHQIDGILGWQILKLGPLAYFPRRHEMWI